MHASSNSFAKYTTVNAVPVYIATAAIRFDAIEHNNTLVVFLKDICKAFDSTNYRILYKNFSLWMHFFFCQHSVALYVREIADARFKSYLSDRKQSKISMWIATKCCIHQGSIPGPVLLFMCCCL